MPNKKWIPAPPREPIQPPLPAYPGGKVVACMLIGYVVLVLLIDTLATQRVHWPFDWNAWFSWKPRDLAGWMSAVMPDATITRRMLDFMQSPHGNQFDLFKLTSWFVIPVLISLRWMDWGAWGLGRWKGRDWALLAFAGVAGLGAMFLIPYLPGVRDYYRAAGDITTAQKYAVFYGYNAWTASWLPGWEFLHRYILLAALAVFFPRGTKGWFVVPLLVASSEMIYHLVKPWPEAVAMFGFGFLATAWAYQRSNFLLPLLAHWMIEISLVIFLLMGSR